jgi:threonyl-tRNA synthetase
MSHVTVTLPDGSTKQVENGAPVKAVAEAISPRLADAAIVASVDDKIVDLTYPLTADAKVRFVTNKNSEALEVYRHSTAHLLAAAVTALFPKVQCGIGPPIDDGFFYDFVVERPFVPEDLEAIEAKMKELASKDYVYQRQMWPRQEAIGFFAKRGEPLKVQLIEEKTAGQPEVSVYTIKDKDTFLDFCVGPHVPSTGRLKAFKLTSTSNAYWKGDAKNAPMQRVYGTAFFSQKASTSTSRALRKRRSAITASSGGIWISFRFTPSRQAPRSGRLAGRRCTTRWSPSASHGRRRRSRKSGRWV